MKKSPIYFSLFCFFRAWRVEAKQNILICQDKLSTAHPRTKHWVSWCSCLALIQILPKYLQNFTDIPWEEFSDSTKLVYDLWHMENPVMGRNLHMAVLEITEKKIGKHRERKKNATDWLLL